MTTQAELGQESRFVRVLLPWLVAAGALTLYLLTLNQWVSFTSLPFVARATGQMWTPELCGLSAALGPFTPLYFLLTYPIRLLPEAWIPPALNLFSAVCAAGALAMLARSVALLPHDRTHEQRQREHGAFALLSLRKAWIPPIVAVAVCGLQLSYWQGATAASGSALDVLLFSYLIRCLLEYRVTQRDSWLLRAALVYGAGMTGDWLLIGLLPAFIGSLIWIRGLSFFNLRFLRGMVLCGLAGLTLYLLLPLVYLRVGNGDMSFWQALKANPLTQKAYLKTIWHIPNFLLLLLATTSLLPVVLISFRWASYFGDPSKVGIAITTGVLHLAHGALLVICVWTALDPVFSPHRKGLVIPALDYLSALCVGYFTGYFLLVFKPLPSRMGRSSGSQTALNRLSQWGILALVILVPLGLLCKNLPQIRVTNGSATKEYASLLVQKLPPHAVVLCDSESAQIDYPQKLWLVEAWLARSGKTRNYMLIDTLALQVPAYHGMMRRRYGDDFPVVVNPKSLKKVPDVALVKLALKLSEQHPIYYLHPSFGYYFEFFYPQPHGLVMEMTRYPTNTLNAPPLTDGQVAENEKFWKERQQTFSTLLPWISEDATNRATGIGPLLSRRLHIPFQPNGTAVNLGRFYSQALDHWGVQLQQSGRLREAGRQFDSALALNPANAAAKINGDANQELQAGHVLRVPSNDVLRQELGKYSDWFQILRDDGPFDDPTHCFAQAAVFAQGNLLREAAQQFERVRSFDPDNFLPRFWLARFYANSMPAKSLTLLSELRAHPDTLEEAGIRQQDLSVVEAMALFYSHKTLEAEQVLQNSMALHPGDEALLATVAQISSMFGRVTNALSAVERELVVRPTNMAALVVEGYLQMQMTNFSQAIPPLTRALSIDSNNYTARFDRAIANLCLDQLDQAQQDYRILERVFPGSFKVYYGLGEIAWRRKDTNTAIRYYRLYLTNSAPESPEAKMIAERLQSLTPAPP